MKPILWWLCFAALVLAPAAHSETTLRVATLTSISKSPPLIVAQEKGFFSKQGVAVSLQLFNAGNVAIEGLASGQFDIGMFGDIPGLALLARGFPGKIIAAGLGGPARESVLVRTDSSYKSMKDLKGKRIGLTKGSTNELVMGAIIQKQGLDWSDFNVINLKPEDKPQALALKQVDAVVAWEPVPSIVVVKGIGRRIVSGEGYLDDNLGVMIASNDILKKDPDAVIRFLRGVQEGCVYAQSHPAEMVRLLAEKLRLDKAVLAEAIPTQWWYIEVYADTLPDWTATSALMVRLKRVDKALPVGDYTDFSYLEKALGKRYPLAQKAKDIMKYPVIAASH